MGAYLSAPVTEKTGEEGDSSSFSYGVASMQGWRVDMEDAHLASNQCNGGQESEHYGIYGVFDGHGGREVAQFCSRHMLKVLQTSAHFEEGKIPETLVDTFLRMDDLLVTEESSVELKTLSRNQGEPAEGSEENGQLISKVQLRRILMGMRQARNGALGEAEASEEQDNMFLQEGRQSIIGPSAGCTAVVAVIRKGVLTVGNAGDSRCVLSRNGKAVAMSRDHKPNDTDESQRILKAGGFVADGRVNGSLNLSRAIGDMEYKQRRDLKPEEFPVTAYPEVHKMQLTPEDEFIVLACDGIWDVMTNQDAVNFVRERLPSTPLRRICEQMCDNCLAPDTKGNGKGCDNMTAMIIVIKDAAKKATNGAQAPTLVPQLVAV